MHFSIPLLLAGATAVVADHSYYLGNGQYDQAAQNRDATCSNNCFFQFFTNKCNSDNPACECTLNDMREQYFCCVAKNCLNYVAYEAAERAQINCLAWKLPFADFDFQAKCGVKIIDEDAEVPQSAASSAPASSSAAATNKPSSAAAAAAAASSAASSASQAVTTPASSSAAQASGADASKTSAASGKPAASSSSAGASPSASTDAKAGGSRLTAGAGALLGLAAVVAVAL